MKRTVDKSGNTGGDNRPTRPVRGRRGGRHRGASAGRPTSHENPVSSRQNDAPEGQVGRGAASPLNNSARSIPSGTRRHSASGASAFIGPVAGNASNGSDNAPPSREGGELPDTGAWDASEKAEMIGQLNEYKVRCSNLEEKCGSLEVQVRVLTEAVRTAQASASEKRLEKLVEDLLSKNHELSQKGTRTTNKRILQSIPKGYMGIAMAVEKRLSTFALDETREVVPFKGSNDRHWDGRGTMVDRHGADLGNGVKVVPTSPFVVASRGAYYTPSIPCEVDIIRFLVDAEMGENDWSDVFSDEDAKSTMVGVLSSNNALKTKLKQSLSDHSSSRKRTARDCFLAAHGYNRLHSRVHCSGQEELARKAEEIEVIKSKVVTSDTDPSVIDMGMWRTRTSAYLSMSRPPLVGSSASHHSEVPSATVSAPLAYEEGGEHDDETLPLFADNHAVGTYHLFVGFRPKDDDDVCTTSIISLARLDAWINTVIEHLDSSEGRGGKRQKLYSDSFGKMLELATSQLVGTVRRFVEKWEPEELSLPTLDSYEERKKAVLEMEREATVVMESSIPIEWYISVKSSWFEKYVTDKMGHVHDCFIAKISNDFSSVEMLGEPFFTEST